MDVDLVREMDTVIVESGAYADRSEFLEEAIRDRVQEERQGGDGSLPLTVVALPTTPEEEEPPAVPQQPGTHFGEWASGDVPTLPAADGPGSNFGLHNRDLPTLFAVDLLGRSVVAEGGPVDWYAFLRQSAEAAWEQGRALQTRDLADGRSTKSAAGFPTNRQKRDSAERRFLNHFIGAIKPTGRHGPFFTLRLIGTSGEPTGFRVAPTSEAVALVAQLAAAGVREGPPFAAAAWEAFRAHMEKVAPEEIGYWRRVLAALADQPGREELIARCDWWSGSTRDTNVMGYVARGREWGLLVPELIEGRYHLTELGQAELKQPRINKGEGA